MANVDRYDEICAAFRWDVPERFNIGQACCARWASDRTRFAMYWEDEDGARAAYTFFDLAQHANRLSNALAARGIGRGDKVALLLPQRPETAIAHVAVYQMGAIAVPLSFLFGPDALEYRLADSGASVAIVDPQTAANLEGARAQLPSLAHVIGAAGARGPRYLAWDEVLARASRRFE
ncbi:MAG TPA: AMP-binding protein, partial [Casimicrobiaceae bacterium]|nr:AMP-binding protein [Casimicrobiaceae bacterium]